MSIMSIQVLNYLEFESKLQRSGIGTAARHQREALAETDISVTTRPWQPGSPDTRWPQFQPAPGADLFHLNIAGPHSVALASLAHRSNRPVIMHAHVTKEDFSESFRGSTSFAPVVGKYLRWAYSKADMVLCPSSYTKSTLESYPVEAPIKIISNGVDLDALSGYRSLRESYRSQYNLEGPVVFAVGNVFERKGLTTFCNVAQKLSYDFIWFGPYDSGPQASRSVRHWTSDPPSNVTFTGWIDDVRGGFAAGDIYLFPTKAENQGIAVLEAMACQKAVIIRDIPVFEEFYTDGYDCLKCSTEKEFMTAVERLAADKMLRDRLGSNAQSTAAKHRLENIGMKLANIYERLIEQ
jgi:1,2-diacylglycerol-3-alpha-glucose alpha-1,2-glucosyltransferase